MTEPLLLGAVAYDPKAVTIWEGFRAWLREAGLPFDYILYSHYERQVEDLVAGRLHAAWNSPLAAVRAERLAAANGMTARAVVMRDTDQDLTSVIAVRDGSDIAEVGDLKGRTVAVGAVDSPQSTLIPLAFLQAAGLGPKDITVRRFDIGVGLHGDHIGGERDAARALADGDVDAACMIDGNYTLFQQEGTLTTPTTVLTRTPVYDHCTMTVCDGNAHPETDRLVELLLAMSYDDPRVQPLLEMESLRAWRPGRTSGYGLVRDAVDRLGFYDSEGRITADGYAP